jgi:hypothetical protein
MTLGHKLELPEGCKDSVLSAGKCKVRLTNLEKLFWPETGITKRESLKNAPGRLRKVGDLWKPLLAGSGGFDLQSLLKRLNAA